MNEISTLIDAALGSVHPEWQLPDSLPAVLRRALEDPHCLPEPSCILRAFEQDPRQVRVVIVGQDPYPTPGHAVGLSFSTHASAPIPKSLNNIFREYSEDLDKAIPLTGDLSPWVKQGVLLLNRSLSVSAGKAGSHSAYGWENITEAAVRQIASYPHTAAILWGKSAQTVASFFGDQRCVCSPHPSPLSAYRGFFGSRPFSRVNEILQSRGADPIDWSLTR